MSDGTQKKNFAWYQRSSMIAGITAVAVFIAVALWVLISDRAFGPEPVFEDSAIEARPPGAGTMPDGPADLTREGLSTDFEASDAIDQSATTDATAPLLSTGAGDAPQDTTADDVVPIDNEGGPILPEIEANTDMPVGEAIEDGEGESADANGTAPQQN